MTYEEALEKLTKAMNPHLYDEDFQSYSSPDIIEGRRTAARYDVEKAVEAIGLREMMEALIVIRDSNPIDMALDPQWPSRIAARALTEARDRTA